MPFVLWDVTQSFLQWKNCFLKVLCQQNTTGVVEWVNLSCVISQVTEPISRFRLPPAFRIQARAPLQGRLNDKEQRFSRK